MARYIDPETGATIDYNPPPEVPLPKIPDLSSIFKGSPEKTLKLQLREGQSFAEGVRTAYNFVRDPLQGVSRIEFKFDNCYFVVARLKEDQTA